MRFIALTRLIRSINMNTIIVTGCIGLIWAGGLFQGTITNLMARSTKSPMIVESNRGSGFNESHTANRSVQFIRAIHFQHKSQEKNLKTFLLGKGKKKDIKPTSIFRLSKDRLCVIDTVNGAVIVMDNHGKIKKIVTHVKGLKLLSPVSVCSDDQGNLYVSDSGRQVVLKFNARYKFKGVFISSFQSQSKDKTKTGTPGDINTPIRITGMVFYQGTLYGTDTPNHRVLAFTQQGELKFSFGKRGTGQGEFNFPTHITGDDHYIYITDALNFRVQIFDHSGNFTRTFGSQGRSGGNFSRPKGIAVDRERRIYVTDVMFDNVQIFDFEGQFLYYFGGPGHRDGEFWMPNGIMVDHDNTIWVADTYNNRIQVFQLVENIP